MLNVGLIGAGLVGQKRAANLAGAKLVAVSDRVHERAMARRGSRERRTVLADWEELIRSAKI